MDGLFSRHARFWVELSLTHPIAVRRVKEIMEWVRSGDYDRIVAGNYSRRGQEPAPSAEFDAAVEHYRERFARFLDRTAGSVQDIGKKFNDWLNTSSAEQNDDDDPH